MNTIASVRIVANIASGRRPSRPSWILVNSLGTKFWIGGAGHLGCRLLILREVSVAVRIGSWFANQTDRVRLSDA